MSQVHEKLARQWLAMCERKERPALTIWETEQLLRGWLDRDRLRGLLIRCLPIVQADARMMADITRHSPLDPVSQAQHDSTEYESERLVSEIPAVLAGTGDQQSGAQE